LWIELPSGIDAFQLYQDAMKYGISIAPGQIFSADAHYSHYIRLGFGQTFTPQIKDSITKLGKLISNTLKSS
jgi:DNA-binding transcriptional MocR family regulator